MPVKKIVFSIMCAILAIMIVVAGITIGKASALVQGILNPAPTAADTTAPNVDTTGPVDTTAPEETTAPVDTEPPTTGQVESGHQHSYAEHQVSPATCTEEGYTLYKCSCGDIETRDVVPALGHSYGAGQVISSCTEENYTKYECSTCGHTEKRNITPGSGHNFSITEHFDATCEEDAYTVRKCSNVGCTETETEFLSGTSLGGHKYDAVKETVPATCTENGYTLYTCSNSGCTAEPLKKEITATGHTFGQWTTGSNGKEATCVIADCGITISAGQLKITKEYRNDEGNHYIIEIGTGTDANDIRRLFAYNIEDNRSQEARETNPLTYSLDPDDGLLIVYTDSLGSEQKISLGFKDNSLTIQDDSIEE